jgi:hypothetical protein
MEHTAIELAAIVHVGTFATFIAIISLKRLLWGEGSEIPWWTAFIGVFLPLGLSIAVVVGSTP